MNPELPAANRGLPILKSRGTGLYVALSPFIIAIAVRTILHGCHFPSSTVTTGLRQVTTFGYCDDGCPRTDLIAFMLVPAAHRAPCPAIDSGLVHLFFFVTFLLARVACGVFVHACQPLLHCQLACRYLAPEWNVLSQSMAPRFSRELIPKRKGFPVVVGHQLRNYPLVVSSSSPR